MANPEHVKVLKQGRDAWNLWRLDNPLIVPDLSGHALPELDLSRINFYRADLRGLQGSEANLRAALLREAKLSESILIDAVLEGAVLSDADLSSSDLQDANLIKVKADGTIFIGSDIRCAQFNDAF